MHSRNLLQEGLCGFITGIAAANASANALAKVLDGGITPGFGNNTGGCADRVRSISAAENAHPGS